MAAIVTIGTWVLASDPVVIAHYPPQYTAWSAPTNLGPAVNYPTKTDTQPFISRNERSLFFSSGRPGGFGGFDLWGSERASVDEEWGEPQNLGAHVNSPLDEYGPALSPDEHVLYFASFNRAEGYGDFDLYASRRHNRRDNLDWGPAVNLGSEVNSPFNDTNPTIYDDDTAGMYTLFFQSNRLTGADIFASLRQPDGRFGAPTLVGGVSSPSQDQGPFVTRDGLEMYLTSNRPGGFGLTDIWVSTRSSTSEPWPYPVNLGSLINTAGNEAQPALSFDKTELYFTSQDDLWVSVRTRIHGRDK
jgi:hypothetical protein